LPDKTPSGGTLHHFVKYGLGEEEINEMNVPEKPEHQR
jgi:hypothetical protein